MIDFIRFVLAVIGGLTVGSFALTGVYVLIREHNFKKQENRPNDSRS